MIITFTLSVVKFSTFLVNTLLNSSFTGEYGNLTEKVFISSNNHSGIMISSFPLSKLQIVSIINFNGDPGFRYFCLILFNSLLNTDAVRLARCSSPVIVLCFYLTGIFELQCTGNFALWVPYGWTNICCVFGYIYVQNGIRCRSPCQTYIL